MGTHSRAESALQRYSKLLGLPEISKAELRVCSLLKSNKRLSQVEICLSIVEHAIGVFKITAEDFFNLKNINREVASCRRAAIVLMDKETFLHRKEIAIFIGSAPTQISSTIKFHKNASEVSHTYPDYFEKFEEIKELMETEKTQAKGQPHE